jgi:hypothetical protein
MSFQPRTISSHADFDKFFFLIFLTFFLYLYIFIFCPNYGFRTEFTVNCLDCLILRFLYNFPELFIKENLNLLFIGSQNNLIKLIFIKLFLNKIISTDYIMHFSITYSDIHIGFPKFKRFLKYFIRTT